MSELDNGGRLVSHRRPYTTEEVDAILTEAMWTHSRNLARPAIEWVTKMLKTDPKMRRIIRKRKARETKSARILARQIARAENYIKARPLLRNGKAWR